MFISLVIYKRKTTQGDNFSVVFSTAFLNTDFNVIIALENMSLAFSTYG